MAEHPLEQMLAEEMEAFSARLAPPDEPLRAWRPLGAYPTDYGRRSLVQDIGPEWDFYPSDERLD